MEWNGIGWDGMPGRSFTHSLDHEKGLAKDKNDRQLGLVRQQLPKGTLNQHHDTTATRLATSSLICVICGMERTDVCFVVQFCNAALLRAVLQFGLIRRRPSRRARSFGRRRWWGCWMVGGFRDFRDGHLLCSFSFPSVTKMKRIRSICKCSW
jgi:hypothetical protein